MDQLSQLTGIGAAPISLLDLAIQLSVGTVLGVILRWHFTRFGSVLADRRELGLVFPFVMLTTLLVITVVKSSLALSLGLVGALSIVRFRTPIKEPEELAYLFIAIAAGVGLGANQIPATVFAVAVILLVTALLKGLRRGDREQNLYLSLSLEDGAEGSPLEELNALVAEHVDAMDLRRFETSDGRSDVTYFVVARDPECISRVASALKARYSGISVTFVDQPRVPGL